MTMFEDRELFNTVNSTFGKGNQKQRKREGIINCLVSWLGKMTSIADATKPTPIKVKSSRGKSLAEDKQCVLMQWTTNS